MYAVSSIIKLFLLISLGFVFLLGQGWVLNGPLLYGSLTTKQRDYSLMQELPLTLTSGLIVNYGITLGVQSITVSLIINGILAIFGLCCYGLHIFRSLPKQRPSPKTIIRWVGIILFCLIFLTPILSEPLKDWDARSIWFFHAKMIYIAGSVGQLAGWQHPSITYTHPDYPMLVPVLAAQMASAMNFWNGYIPKASLFFMLAPAIIWLFKFSRKTFNFAFLIFLIPFSFSYWIWNGYMDAYLAFYFSIGMLLFGRFIKYSTFIDLVSSICCLLILLYIKNEGSLLALIGFCLILLAMLLKINFSIRQTFLKNWKYWLALSIAFIPLILWNYYKYRWNVTNDLEIGTISSLLRIGNRLSNSAYLFIIREAFKQIEGPLLLLGLSYFVSVIWGKPLPKESIPALLAAGIYCIGLIIIYLLTPADLTWHVKESINRTMLPVNGGIIVGAYYILSSLEESNKVLEKTNSTSRKTI